MSILSWDKPARVKSTKDWKSLSAEGAPPGVYTPNMSEADMEKWKAKLVGHKVGQPRVEIRKTAGAQILIIVSLTGTEYPDKYGKVGGEDMNVQISANSQIHMTFEDFSHLQEAVAEARKALEDLKSKGTP